MLKILLVFMISFNAFPQSKEILLVKAKLERLKLAEDKISTAISASSFAPDRKAALLLGLQKETEGRVSDLFKRVLDIKMHAR